MSATVSRTRAGLAGLAAAALGMGVGHVVAGLVAPAASPVLAVSAAVIDRTPTTLKDWAIRQFGESDKLILLASVALITAVAAAGTGLAARRRLRFGVLAQLALVALALAAVVERPTFIVRDLIPGVATGVCGVLTLTALMSLASGSARIPFPYRGSLPPDQPAGHTRSLDSRRAFLAGSAGTLAVAAGTSIVGQRLTQAKDTSQLSLPVPRERLPALPAGLETRWSGITGLRTSNSRFYRVDTSLTVPRLDRDSWSLRIDGDVDNPIDLSYRDLLELEVVERDITMTCVSNTVGGGYVGSARWLGVRTRDVLRLAGIRGEPNPSRQVFSTSSEGFTISTPLAALLDDREALLAFGMNGEPLPPIHGFPVRMVTPGLYGFVGSTKWVTSMRVTDYDSARAYWTARRWATDAPVKPSARIDTPRSFAAVSGRTIIGGVAWAQRQGVVRVQVRVDDQPWANATLGPEVNVDYWRQWYYVWERPEAGQHTLQARVLFGADEQVQDPTRAEVFPSGSSGIQSVIVTAS
ncbi:molybdopterin-dependent oxidoreductase [Dermacoccaceae bacterium W4C1]